MSNSETSIELYASVQQAYDIGKTLGEQGIADTPIGRAAIEGAYQRAAKDLVNAPEADVFLSLETYQRANDAVQKLEGLRTQLEALDLSTGEIQDRLVEENAKLDNDTRFLAAFVTTTALINTRVETLLGERRLVPSEDTSHQTNITPSVQPTGQKGSAPTDSASKAAEALDDDLPTALIRLVRDDKRGGYLQIGARKIALSGSNTPAQRNYAPERFAALAVMSELLPEEEIAVSDLWARLHTILGEATTPEYDRLTMHSVRNWITGLRYRNQSIFQHNGMRGPASAYSLNPDLRYEVVLDTPDDATVAEFAQYLMQIARTPVQTLPVPNVIPAPEEVAASRSDLLPNMAELHSFLVKLNSTMSIVTQQIDSDEFPMIGNMYSLAEEMLDVIEESEASQTLSYETDDELRQLRRAVANKFIAITEDEDLLNRLLEEDSEGLLKEVYGEQLGDQIFSLVETIVDMDEQEKEFLRQIIAAEETTQIKLFAGSFSRGIDVLGIARRAQTEDGEVFTTGTHASSPLEPQHLKTVRRDTGEVVEMQTSIEQDTPADLQGQLMDLGGGVPDDDEPLITEQVNRSGRLQAGTDEPLDTHESNASEATTQRAGLKRQLSTWIGEKLSMVEQFGFDSTSRFNIGQLDSIFGLKVTHVVNARENGLISHDTKHGFSVEDVVSLLMHNDSNPEARKVLENPRGRKQLRKVIKSSVKAFAQKD